MKAELPTFEPNVILCVAAHPDDLENAIGGSVAQWTAAGVQVHYLICSSGGKGVRDRSVSSEQLARIRQREQRQAADLLGVKSVEFLDYEDGAVENCPALKRDIVRAIRRIKPDTVVAFDPMFIYDAAVGVINHADHRNVGLAAIDVVYPLARDHMSFPELLDEGLEPHKVGELLLTRCLSPCEGNYFVDISTTYDKKIDALAAHRSQFDIAAIEPLVNDMAQNTGKCCGCDKAEGFIRIRMSF